MIIASDPARLSLQTLSVLRKATCIVLSKRSEYSKKLFPGV